MLIVFGMFFLGTAAVIILEVRGALRSKGEGTSSTARLH
jgi:hypothetical protein